MYIANYHLHGELVGESLPSFLSDAIGLYGNTNEATSIVIHINSPGGDLVTAIQAYNLIKASPIPVTTLVNGSAESAALIILMAGHRRAAMKNSFGMAHHLSTGIEGNFHTIKDSVKHLDILHKTIKDMWLADTKVKPSEVEELMLGRGDTYLPAADMRKKGIVDEILDPSGLIQYIYGFRKDGKPQKKKSTKAKKHL